MFHVMEFNEFVRIKKDPSAPYGVFVPNVSSSHLIVYFGSYGGEFRGDETVRRTNSNGLFVRSNPATWYLDTAHPLGATPPEIAKNINTFIQSMTHINTITLAGFSMGGFASLLFSPWIKADLIIANAPQTRFPTWKQLDGIVPKCPDELKEFTEIKNVWNNHSAPSGDVVIRCCDKLSPTDKFKDIEDAQQLKEFNNVTIQTYDCEGHKNIDKHLLSDNYNNMFLV